MQAAEVMTRLIEIEKIVGKADPVELRSLLIRVEEGLLHLEQLTLEALRENAMLRMQMENEKLSPFLMEDRPFDA